MVVHLQNNALNKAPFSVVSLYKVFPIESEADIK